MKFYLSGQRSFGNRGCEAIIRSTVSLLRTVRTDAEFLVPSVNPEFDQRQWPQHTDLGVRFVKAYIPQRARLWAHFQRIPLDVIKSRPWPFPLPSWVRDDLAEVDAVLAVGGDNYSLDYRIPALYQGFDAFAIKLGKPVYLWGASVGPFEKEPAYKPTITKHLAKIRKIYVRENASYTYLTEALGLKNVRKSSDSAFLLQPELSTGSAFARPEGRTIVGLNVSPLLERFNPPEPGVREIMSRFVEWLLKDQSLNVLLVPHVIYDEGRGGRDDHDFMAEVLAPLQTDTQRVRLVDKGLNAAELKAIIGSCDVFIGARTHATIAALSSHVPTASIAYSVKARGLNRALFGNERYVIPSDALSLEKLKAMFELVMRERSDITSTLKSSVAREIALLREVASEVISDVEASK